MNSKTRVLSCIDRQGYDRIPVSYQGVRQIDDMLKQYFAVDSKTELLNRLGVDFREVEPKYRGPELRRFPDGSFEGLWGERYHHANVGSGFFQEPVYAPFADVVDVDQLSSFRWPSADWYDYSSVAEEAERQSDFATYTGHPGFLDFLNGIGVCRGQEQVLCDVATEDPVFLELVERRFRFYYDTIKNMLDAANGLIDIVWIGEDLGTQSGPIIAPDTFSRLFGAKYKATIDLVHQYEARVMMHSCGSIRPFVPTLVELGLDVLDVVQVSARDMSLEELNDDFGADLCFSGSMCVQTLLVEGNECDVVSEVKKRLAMFPCGGLILGPANTIELGTPRENILGMYRTAGSLS